MRLSSKTILQLETNDGVQMTIKIKDDEKHKQSNESKWWTTQWYNKWEWQWMERKIVHFLS